MSQIDVIKENVQYEQLLREGSTNHVLKGEYLIKDSHPDAHQILGVDAKATVTNKDILADKVMIEGQINYSVLYLSEDESGMQRVDSVSLSEKFADYLELNNEEHKILCDVECVIEHIQANIINERKISIDGVRSTKWNIYKIQDLEFVKDIEGSGDVQVQRKSEELNQVKGQKDVEFIGKSLIKVTMDKPEVDEVLKYSMMLHKKEVKLGEDKVYFGCYCKIEVLYKGRESEDLVLLQDDVYLSKEEELVGINSEMMTSQSIDIVNSDCTVMPDDLGENRNISVEFVAKGNVKVMSREMVDVVKDAYSPTVSMELVENKCELGVVHGSMTTDLILKDNLYLKDENERLGNIIMVYGCPVITDKIAEEDKVKVEGVIKVSALYKTADEAYKFNMCNGEIPFTSVLDIKGTKPDMNVIAKVQLETIDGTVEANTIAIRATLTVSVKVLYNVDKNWVVDVVQNKEEKKEKQSSVTIYVVNKGDTLWELAKKFNTTMDELIRINEMDNPDVINIGQRIIVPGRAIF